jgi:hypothetical protein
MCNKGIQLVRCGAVEFVQGKETCHLTCHLASLPVKF